MHAHKRNTIAILTAVVPVSRMAGRLDSLKSWLIQAASLPIEIVIVHDVQDDDTSEELQSLVHQDESGMLFFVEGKFGSPGAARNEGLNLAQGEWIVFWDSDDTPNVLSVMSSINGANENTQVIIGNFKVSNGDQTTLIKHFNSKNFVALYPGLWRLVFRREAIKNLRFKNLRMGEDQLYIAETGINQQQTEFVELDFYTYRIGHPSQLTVNPSAVYENILALSELSNRIATEIEYQNKFCEIMQVRLFISTIKYRKRKNTKYREFFSIYRNQKIKTRNLVYVIVLLMLFQIRLKSSSLRIRKLRRAEKIEKLN